MWEYVGGITVGVIKGDTRSVDYGSYSHAFVSCSLGFGHLLGSEWLRTRPGGGAC